VQRADAVTAGAEEVVVHADRDAGPLGRLWESVGYDEINWTYTRTGHALLRRFADLSEHGFHVRPHYVFCSGNAYSTPHWGNGNVYHEDAEGTPYYDFTVVDQTYDAIVEAGHHVLVELAFTPHALLPDEADAFTVPPSPTVYSSYEHGAWSYPPKDYAKWGGLVAAHVAHCLERYGEDEVGQWLWELWNEPDIFYWNGTPEQFYELYSVTAAAVRSVMPTAKVGGPAVTGGGADFLRGFLEHTRRHEDPLDFVSFHTKGSAFTPWRTYGPTGAAAPVQENPSAHKMLFEVRRLLRVVGEFEEYRGLPAIVDECDAGVPAHHGFYDNANFGFQNTEYYPVFQVKLMKKLLDLNKLEDVQVTQATAWAWYFEGERLFEGTRAFLTADGVEKPLLNGYRALAHLGSRRVEAASTGEHPVTALDDDPGSSMPEEVDVLASRDDSGRLTVLVWRHTDDQYQRDEQPAEVVVTVDGLSEHGYLLRHWRIDEHYSNAHTVWRGLGSPQLPSDDELATIHGRQGLEELEPAREVLARDGRVRLDVRLPLPAVSLLVLAPR